MILLLLVCLLLLAACGGKDVDVGQPDYDQTKKMIVDILKT